MSEKAEAKDQQSAAALRVFEHVSLHQLSAVNSVKVGAPGRRGELGAAPVPSITIFLSISSQRLIRVAVLLLLLFRLIIHVIRALQSQLLLTPRLCDSPSTPQGRRR